MTAVSICRIFTLFTNGDNDSMFPGMRKVIVLKHELIYVRVAIAGAGNVLIHYLYCGGPGDILSGSL